MLKKGWRKLKRIFENGSVKLATRRLSRADRLKYDALVRRQDELVRKFKKVLDAYEDKLLEISHLLDQSRQGETQRLAHHISGLQQELEVSLERTQISIDTSSELQKELSDRQRGLRIHAARTDDEPRLHWLKDELRARGFTADEDCASVMSVVLNQARDELTEVADDELAQEASDKQESYQPSEDQDDEGDQPMVNLVLAADTTADHLALDADQLAARIKELSRELARFQVTPQAEPSESLSIARQIRDLHTLLRRTDKESGVQRDRLSATDGFWQVFQRS